MQSNICLLLLTYFSLIDANTERRRIYDRKRVRLVGPNTKGLGKPLIRSPYNKSWGSVCWDQFDNFDANVICQEIGFNGGLVYEGESSSISKYVKVVDLNCNAWEDSIYNCLGYNGEKLSKSYGQGGETCTNRISPWVSCFKLRLVNSTSTDANAGRLEIYDPFSSNHWHSICNRSFGQHEANLACRHLGFNFGRVLYDHEYGEGQGEIALDQIDCDYEYDGNEVRVETLAGCGRNENFNDSILNFWGQHDCTHEDDVALSCN